MSGYKRLRNLMNVKMDVFIRFLLCLVGVGMWMQVMAQKPELVVPLGHTSGVLAVAFSPDSRHALTGSFDGTAKLWDVQSGREIRTFAGHNFHVTAVNFSPNGRYVLTGSRDRTAKLWDVRNGQVVRTFVGHAGEIYAAIFSPDGRYVLTGSTDKAAKLWDTQSGQVTSTFYGHARTISSVAFSPDGSYILTGSDDGTAKIWNLRGEEIQSFKGHTGGVQAVDFSPSGRYVLTGSSDNAAKLWDSQSGQIVRTFVGHTSGISDVSFSPDGRYMLTGSYDETAKLWDSQSGQVVKTFICHIRSVYAVAFSPDGRYILTGGNKPTKLWESQSGQEIRTFAGHTSDISSISFSSDGHHILMGSSDMTAKLWDTQSGQAIHTFAGHTAMINTVGFSSDGRYVLTGSFDKTAKLWNAQNGQEIRTFVGHTSAIYDVAFSSDGRYVLTGSHDQTIKLWDSQNGQAVRTHTLDGHTREVSTIAFSPNGRYVLTGSGDQTVKLWDNQNGQEIRTFEHSGWVFAVAFSTDGRYVLTGSSNRKVILWDSQKGKTKHTLASHTGAVSDAAFSPDGRYVLTGSQDQTAKLWDSKKGQEICTFTGHTGEVNTVVFSPNGYYILTGSADKTTKLWNLQGEELATLISVDSTDWIVTTPSGLFDASPGAMKLMHFVKGLEVIELEQLKERYYEPGLLAKIMGYQEGGVRDVEVFDQVNLYPEIHAEVTNHQLNIQLTERNGGIGKVSVFVNDKEVIQDANQERKTNLNIDLNQFSKYYLSDTNNQIAIRAYNEEGWLKSRAYTLEYKPPQSIRAVPPSLYAVVIGTAEYNGDRLDLSYSDQDASAMAKALQTSASGLFEDRVNIQLLNTDPSSGSKIATKANIQAAFQNFAQEAKAQDILIVYLSGHGVNYGSSETAQFYYLTKDIFSEDLSDPEIRNQYAISTNELTTWINDIPAQKQVMILDACNSGKVVEDLLIAQKELNSTQIRALDRMKDRTGMFILAGSAADKASFEASQYGQGLLTYSLLSGMSGLALTDDKRIDVMKLFQYSRDQVPQLAKDIGGIQTPVLAFPYGGSSFDIGIVKTEADIPVATAKPVFIRSVFLDSDFGDALGLVDALNAYFRGMGSKGTGAPILYVDVSKYEQAYSIRGQYRLEGDTVHLNAKLFKGSKARGSFDLTGNREDISGLVKAIVKEVGGLIK